MASHSDFKSYTKYIYVIFVILFTFLMYNILFSNCYEFITNIEKKETMSDVYLTFVPTNKNLIISGHGYILGDLLHIESNLYTLNGNIFADVKNQSYKVYLLNSTGKSEFYLGDLKQSPDNLYKLNYNIKDLDMSKYKYIIIKYKLLDTEILLLVSKL